MVSEADEKLTLFLAQFVTISVSWRKPHCFFLNLRRNCLLISKPKQMCFTIHEINSHQKQHEVTQICDHNRFIHMQMFWSKQNTSNGLMYCKQFVLFPCEDFFGSIKWKILNLSHKMLFRCKAPFLRFYFSNLLMLAKNWQKLLSTEMFKLTFSKISTLEPTLLS